MTEPTPLTLYLGRSYLVTIQDEQDEADADVGGIAPIAWSQSDPRWAHLDYAPGFQFVQAGCLVCCVAMLASIAYPESPPTPPEVATRLQEMGCFADGLLSHPGRIPYAYERLGWGGYLHWRDVPARLDLVTAEIANYGATIVELAWNPKGAPVPQQGNQHFAVAIEVLRTLTPPDVLIIDPWDGQQKTLSSSAYAKPAGWSAARAIHGVRLVRAGG